MRNIVSQYISHVFVWFAGQVKVFEEVLFFLLNCAGTLLSSNGDRHSADCLCKDSCEVVSADESQLIGVCFCLQKHPARNCTGVLFSNCFGSFELSSSLLFSGDVTFEHDFLRKKLLGLHYTEDKKVAEIQ